MFEYHALKERPQWSRTVRTTTWGLGTTRLELLTGLYC